MRFSEFTDLICTLNTKINNYIFKYFLTRMTFKCMLAVFVYNLSMWLRGNPVDTCFVYDVTEP